MNDLPYVIDNTGIKRQLGTLLGDSPEQITTKFDLYEDSHPVLTWNEIEDIAKSGIMDGRKRFSEDDWVKDQRSHGSCNGYAGAMAQSKARVLRGSKRVDLSGAYLYSLINGNRDNGSQLYDGMQALMQRGCCPDTMLGWDDIYRNRYDTAKCDQEAVKYKAFETYVIGDRDIDQARLIWYSGLASGFVGVCAVHVASRFMRVDQYGIAGIDKGPGNHAVHAAGISWRNGKLVEDGFNSWNLSYGERGRMGMTWDHHTGTFAYHAHYLIKTTIDNPDDEQPPKVKTYAELIAD